jgi:hypothetical protein
MAKKHRGRIQAQGDGTEKSVSWSQDTPLSKKQGLALLEDLEGQLTKKEREERKKQLVNAQRFIENIEGGIDAVNKKSFYSRDKGNLRIDIEVLGGIAFICMMVGFLLFLFFIKS